MPAMTYGAATLPLVVNGRLKGQTVALVAGPDSPTDLVDDVADAVGLNKATVYHYYASKSLILFDIDFFKQINDKYGHDGGDHCLISLAQALRQQLRAQDAMGRWGGEEFLILLPETTQQQALQVADKLRQSIEQNPIRYRQLRIPVSITAGVVEYDLHSELDACIEKADKALYQGKQGGRNRCIAAVQLVSEWQ